MHSKLFICSDLQFEGFNMFSLCKFQDGTFPPLQDLHDVIGM